MSTEVLLQDILRFLQPIKALSNDHAVTLSNLRKRIREKLQELKEEEDDGK